MALRPKVLKIKAQKFELKKLQLLEVTKERVAALEPLLQDIYNSRRPKPNDYETRRELVRVFNDIAKDIFGHSNDIPVVVEFGSFVMDLFTTSSDLDLSVNFKKVTDPFPREKKIKTLRKFARKLYAIQSIGHVTGVLPIPQAKVPILKCIDIGTGVECDISVENRDGILKSQIIQIISSIDERFKKLSFLMKNWAKAHNINSSKDKTLNSLSIILLVAFHLQTRNPPILPPFAAIFKDGTDPETVEKSLSNFVNYGQRNKESLAELFVTLLIKLSSVEKLWPKGLCASACTASWTSKTWDSKVACISVEDFTDQSQNVARAVGQAEMKLIYKCIDISLKHIFSFTDGQIGGNVKDLLFGRDGFPTSIPRRIRDLHVRAALPGVPSQEHQTRGNVTGKRKKRAMRGESRIIPVGVQKPKALESCLGKRTRTAEGWRVMPDGSWAPPPVEDPIVGQHVDSTQQQHARGWDELESLDWDRTEQAAAAEGWAVTRQPRNGGWGETGQPSSSSWGGTEKLSGWGRGWAGTVQPCAGGWRVTQKSSAKGWGEAQQLSGGGWGGTLQHTA
ncbi:hypothetical protein ACS0TY_005608 [Phlomoides rotata]